MDLNTVWFIIIAFFFTGYFVLEGFDFGVGMLLPFLRGDSAADSDARRTAAVRAIGPVWDGNEVWLIVAGASIFAAFPEWYATLFSGFYLPLLLIVTALIIRGVSLEWRVKVDTLAWRKRCDIGIVLGSYLPALLWGVAMTNIVAGVAFSSPGHVDSGIDGFLGLLNPRGLLGGAVFLLLFAFHGALFLGLKTHAPVRTQVHAIARGWLAIATLAVGAIYLVWMQLNFGKSWTWIALAAVALALVAAFAGLWSGRDRTAFFGTAAAIIAVGLALFGALFPNVLPSVTDVAGLDIYTASASPYTLKIMTWAAVVLAPAVLIGQGWTYWQFRARIGVHA
ncbi:cytochrome d ubiquinol oxidase subunit II [Corynebacterium striatum]|uniref:cytochrome d ubiquinol oxidase subunit II n=1 Tax=Corynebacterium striatum TaxID=43770 RepID=UPI001661FF69|nr:cytochrome d ubiquinol oxidase subunit II [Corynebacterium striatum]MBD0854593.1 cytochrome d ubiquinol oxidase subunit II [Corynebacterium striatum]MDK8844470.1 cytochrome d ubiquinol oxidase subunit II [Corynebacterium striatum]